MSYWPSLRSDRLQTRSSARLDRVLVITLYGILVVSIQLVAIRSQPIGPTVTSVINEFTGAQQVHIGCRSPKHSDSA